MNNTKNNMICQFGKKKRGIIVCIVYGLILFFFRMDISEKLLLAMASDLFWNKYLDLFFYSSFFVVLFCIYKKCIWELMKDFIKNRSTYIKACIICFFIIIFLMVTLAIILSFFISAESSNEQNINISIQNNKVITSIVACLIGPFVEEIIFRGILYETVKGDGKSRVKRYVSICIVSLIFTLYHCDLSVVMKDNMLEVVTNLPLFVMALTLNCLYEKTNNILSPLLVHIGINIVSLYG